MPRVSDWAASKAIWEAVKVSGIDIDEGVAVFIGVEDGDLAVTVYHIGDVVGEEDVQELEDRIEYLEARMRHPAGRKLRPV